MDADDGKLYNTTHWSHHPDDPRHLPPVVPIGGAAPMPPCTRVSIGGAAPLTITPEPLRKRSRSGQRFLWLQLRQLYEEHSQENEAQGAPKLELVHFTKRILKESEPFWTEIPRAPFGTTSQRDPLRQCIDLSQGAPQLEIEHFSTRALEERELCWTEIPPAPWSE